MVSGPLDSKLGWVMDYTELDAAWQHIHATLDHRYLNDIAGLDNPTSENLVLWLWNTLYTRLPLLTQITVMEAENLGCTYRGPNR